MTQTFGIKLFSADAWSYFGGRLIIQKKVQSEERKQERRRKKLEQQEEYRKAVAARLAEHEKYAAKLAELERVKWEPRILRIQNSGMIDVYIYDSHARAKNWAAIVEVEPTKPGGLKRFFFDYGRGVVRHIVPERLQCGDIVEFAADYASSTGKKSVNRAYCVITSLSKDAMGIHPYPSFQAAFNHTSTRVE